MENEALYRRLYNDDLIEHGCGYYGVCLEHDCPCHPDAAVSKGFDLGVYLRLKKESDDEYRRGMDEIIRSDPFYDPERDGVFDDDEEEDEWDGYLEEDEDEGGDPVPERIDERPWKFDHELGVYYQD